MRIAVEGHLALPLRRHSHHQGLAGGEMYPFDTFPEDLDAFRCDAKDSAANIGETTPCRTGSSLRMINDVGTPATIGVVLVRA